jgi:cellulose synthase/poly-beta-1,6-N-acetylglucosamine synthase-like glycosyltransferase
MTNVLAPPPASGHVAPGRRPSLSVVIGAFNASGTIDRAVRSALNQTEPAHEVIVCDDGSSDVGALEEALQPYANRVRLAHCDHAGASRSRNTAVAHATGQVVVVLDADDYWERGRLAAIADAFEARPDLGMVTTDAFLVREGFPTVRFYDINRFPVDDQRRQILRRTFVFSHFAVPRDLWLRVGGMDESLKVGEDWDLTLRLIMRGELVGLVREALATYNPTPDSLSGPRARSLAARVELLDRAARRYRLTPQEEQARREARDCYHRLAVLAKAEDARAGRGGRVDLLRVACTKGVRFGTRAKHAAAALAPAGVLRSLNRPG